MFLTCAFETLRKIMNLVMQGGKPWPSGSWKLLQPFTKMMLMSSRTPCPEVPEQPFPPNLRLRTKSCHISQRMKCAARDIICNGWPEYCLNFCNVQPLDVSASLLMVVICKPLLGQS